MNENMFHITLLILVLIAIIQKPEDRVENPSTFHIIAHRGASFYAPEHTAAAFDKAIAMKADFIELDVQMSKDGNLVVIHDISVERTTNGSGYIQDLTLRELKKLDAGSWFHPRFKNERILTLDEVLNRYGRKINFLIEIKNPSLYPDIEKKVVKTLKKRIAKGISSTSFIIQSFDIQVIKQIKTLLPSISSALLLNIHSSLSDQLISKWSKFVDFINPHYLITNRPLVNHVHNAGMKLYPWGINDKKVAQRMFEYQADGIITNNLLIFEEINHQPRLITNSPSKDQFEFSQLNELLTKIKNINIDEVFLVIQNLINVLNSKVK
jgi:glycerophosphoryl diester phosphodiesterase